MWWTSLSTRSRHPLSLPLSSETRCSFPASKLRPLQAKTSPQPRTRSAKVKSTSQWPMLRRTANRHQMHHPWRLTWLRTSPSNREFSQYQLWTNQLRLHLHNQWFNSRKSRFLNHMCKLLKSNNLSFKLQPDPLNRLLSKERKKPRLSSHLQWRRLTLTNVLLASHLSNLPTLDSKMLHLFPIAPSRASLWERPWMQATSKPPPNRSNSNWPRQLSSKFSNRPSLSNSRFSNNNLSLNNSLLPQPLLWITMLNSKLLSQSSKHLTTLRRNDDQQVCIFKCKALKPSCRCNVTLMTKSP